MNHNKFTFIDLFSGTSALSEGFVNNGFIPLAHIEMDKSACNTIRTRVAYHYLKQTKQISVYTQYLKGQISRDELYRHIPEDLMASVINKEISDDTVSELFSQIEDSGIYRNNGRKVDFIVGGPPCQAYSMVVRHKKGIDSDDRCFLYRQYGKFLAHFKPLGFVFENVIGLMSAAKGKHFEELSELFSSIGYTLYPVILNANNYGVLQNRRRLIIFGWKKDFQFDGAIPLIVEHCWTTKDVFADLADIQANDFSNQYKSEPSGYLKEFKLRNEADVLTWHVSRPLNPIDREKYIYAINEKLYNKRQISYLEFDERLQTMKKANAFTDRFKVVDPDGMSQTIVAHLSKDGHYYIYPSTKYVRSISVREAARLQSFPDNFFFEGSRSAAFKQIGNAVPPLLSEAIARKVLSTLQNLDL